MGSEEKSQAPKLDREILGELLKARVQAFRDGEASEGSASPQNLTCSECGTQLSDSSEFCWMCGATRNTPQPRLVSPKSVDPPRLEATVHTFAPPTASSEDSRYPSGFTPGAYSSAATAYAYETSTTPGSASPADVLEQLRREPLTPEEDEEKPRRFDYRIAVLAVLALTLLVLGYRQRNNAKAFYAMARQTIAQELGRFWESDKQPDTERKSTGVQTATRTKAHPKSARRASGRTSGSVVSAADKRPDIRKPSFLRVRVDGQPGPEMISFVSHAPSSAFMGDAARPAVQAAGQAVAPPFAVTISPQESLSLLLKQVQPTYPQSARAAGATGPVVLRAIIHKDGNVGALSIVTGHPLLTQSAIEAVRQWVYRPYYRGGEPMEVETLVVVDFTSTDRAEVIGKHRPGN